MAGDKVELACPECKSKRLIKFGRRYRRAKDRKGVVVIQRWCCKKCRRVTVEPVRVGRRA